MKVYTVHIEESVPEKEALKWIWETFAQFAALKYEYISSSSADFTIGTLDSCTIKYNNAFWDKIKAKQYAGKVHLNKEGFVLFENGDRDVFSTAFYFINCVWEYDVTNRDSLGRSDYSQSVWKEMDLDCSINRVTEIFKTVCIRLGIPVPSRASEIFLSHDIDSLYGAWKEDGKAALKNYDIDAFIDGICAQFFGRPGWYNIRDIITVERMREAKSTFFWLTEKGRIDARKTNSDYDISSEAVRKLITMVDNNGFENGLHKSLSTTTFQEEFQKLKVEHAYNRHHYLHFSIPESYKTWEEAGLMVDCSMGYAEHFGFRNGYGLPFFPFDVISKRTVPVLEVPLHIMDGTFSKYKNLPAETAKQMIVDFIEKNREHAVISILWHNSHFTNHKYAGYPKLYEQLLEWINSQGLKYVSLTELLAQYGRNDRKAVTS